MNRYSIVKHHHRIELMGIRTTVIVIALLLMVIVTMYGSGIGLGILITHWAGDDIETGCDKYKYNETGLQPYSKPCQPKLYRCDASSAYNLYLVCAGYGVPIYVIALGCGVCAIKKIFCDTEDDEFDDSYQTPYSDVIDYRSDV
jgi:hypothetical protein